MTEMCRLLTTHRIASGWQPEDRADLEIRARVYIDRLDMARVPAEFYMELYKRFSETRAKAMREGVKAPELSADALASHWEGPNGLQTEVAERSQTRRLGGGLCPHCHGTGFRTAEGVDPRYPGVRKCDH